MEISVLGQISGLISQFLQKLTGIFLCLIIHLIQSLRQLRKFTCSCVRISVLPVIQPDLPVIDIAEPPIAFPYMIISGIGHQRQKRCLL